MPFDHFIFAWEGSPKINYRKQIGYQLLLTSNLSTGGPSLDLDFGFEPVPLVLEAQLERVEAHRIQPEKEKAANSRIDTAMFGPPRPLPRSRRRLSVKKLISENAA